MITDRGHKITVSIVDLLNRRSKCGVLNDCVVGFNHVSGEVLLKNGPEYIFQKRVDIVELVLSVNSFTGVTLVTTREDNNTARHEVIPESCDKVIFVIEGATK